MYLASRTCLGPNCQSSRLDMEANFSSEDKNLDTQRTNINKGGIYVQVSYRGLC